MRELAEELVRFSGGPRRLRVTSARRVRLTLNYNFDEGGFFNRSANPVV